jgi:hypothetical protein
LKARVQTACAAPPAEQPAWVDRSKAGGMLAGMTKAKIAVTLPRDLVARAKRAVRKGTAESVSAYVSAALVEKAKVEDLSEMLERMLEETGGPLSERERRAADRALGVRRRRMTA